MKLHLLSGGRLRMRKSVFMPGTDRSETFDLPVICALLRHRQGNLLFDTGCHPSIVQDAAARWGGLAKIMQPVMAQDDHLITGLDGLGLGADDIDVVVCSHLHPDHCGCNAFFPRATVIVHADELVAAKATDAGMMGYVAAEWDHPNPTDPITQQRDVFGDGRITLLPLPGHTPGSIAALATLDRDGAFLLASDTVSLREALDRDIAPRNTWNAEKLLASFAEVRRIERSGATIVCGHDHAQWAGLRKGARAYE